MRSSRILTSTSAALLLGVLPLVAGHEENGDMSMHMDAAATAATASNTTALAEVLPNYFRHPHYAGWIYAHGALMLLAWAAIMPLAMMLSMARSRYHLPAQLVFHLVNGLGVFTGFVYNHATPDLYVHNSHHPIGWIVTAVPIAWTVMSLFVAYSEHKGKRKVGGSTGRVSRFTAFQRYRDSISMRSSRDSGRSGEGNSGSLMGSRQSSQDTLNFKPVELEDPARNEDDDDSGSEKHGLLGDNKVDRFVSRSVRRFATPRASKAVRFLQIVTEKFLLLFGYLAILTGFVVWGGLFRDREVFSGLAHWIKGSIFFWYGLLTLGRWMGAFTEFGWAWNLRPNHPTVARWKTRIPSGEFVESFVIYLYGQSNVFLEHLNRWGKEWSPQDFEHISITMLFFGGGLLGMMIESRWASRLLNTTVDLQREQEEDRGEVEGQMQPAVPSHASDAAEVPQQLWTQPASYRIPLNPMPGLVIMLLGIMMSSHHQDSMVSTMLHAQWGTLFCGFALARGATYIILFVRPPTSHFPARPPSELISAFCLTAGGLMFMFSARDFVYAIEGNGLDAMTVFTVTMGLAALILAWEICCYAVKGWAVRRERAAVNANAAERS